MVGSRWGCVEEEGGGGLSGVSPRARGHTSKSPSKRRSRRPPPGGGALPLGEGASPPNAPPWRGRDPSQVAHPSKTLTPSKGWMGMRPHPGGGVEPPLDVSGGGGVGVPPLTAPPTSAPPPLGGGVGIRLLSADGAAAGDRRRGRGVRLLPVASGLPTPGSQKEACAGCALFPPASGLLLGAPPLSSPFFAGGGGTLGRGAGEGLRFE